jgi:hypothetical protein
MLIINEIKINLYLYIYYLEKINNEQNEKDNKYINKSSGIKKIYKSYALIHIIKGNIKRETN